MKKRIIVLLLIIIIMFAFPLPMAIAYSHSIGKIYDETYLGAMSDKYQRLESISVPKIVLVGGSNLAFGIDSALIEEKTNHKVVNFGLYAALGSKTTMDLSLANIRQNDIVIFVPEYSAQTYSKYVNPEIMLQILDSNNKILAHIPREDMFSLINAYPNFVNSKRKLQGNKPTGSGVYSRAAFNEYGDIGVERKYNVLADLYDPVNTVGIDKSIINAEFVDYFNEYAQTIKSKGAKIWISFPPTNALSLTEDSDLEKRLEFYDYVVENFDADVISNIEDYILNEGYFYDSNYHLNDSGVAVRTAKLIIDIKRELGDTSANVCPMPQPSGAEPIAPHPDDGENETPGGNTENPGGNTENPGGNTDTPNDDEPNDDNPISVPDEAGDASNFLYEVVSANNRIAITGLSQAGKSVSRLVIPHTIDGKTVYRVKASAFEGSTALSELLIPSGVTVIDDGAFEGANNLVKVTLTDGAAAPTVPIVGNGLLTGANPSLTFYVSPAKYYVAIVDYFWGVYSDKIEKCS